MLKKDLVEQFKKAVCIDINNHSDAKKDHCGPWIPLEILKLIENYPDDFTVDWIKEQIDSREKSKKLGSDYHSEMELIALNHCKKQILKDFPNSFF